MKLVKPLELFQSLAVSGGASSGRLLGLDVGQKYVGLAVSDPSNKVALSLSVLERKKTNIEFMAGDFKNLVSRLSLVGFIVGYPCNLLGQSSIEAVQIKLFMENLRKTGRLDGLKYTYWNESFTSKCVQALINPLSLHPKTAKILLDKYAAVGILQGYLDNMQRSMKSGSTTQEQWNFDKKFILKP